MIRPDIELQIDELVLHGFQPKDRFRIMEAVQEELHRMFSSEPFNPIWKQDTSIDRINAGSFNASSATPDRIGTAVAQSVYAGLRRDA